MILTIIKTDHHIMAKRIFISGAAQGIGAAIAKYFHQHKWIVGIYDLDQVKAQALAQSLGDGAFAGELNVIDYASWQNALADFVKHSGGLNILVNNAGILYSGAFEDTPIEAHHRTIDVNVKGVLNGCHAVLPYLKHAKNARVINLSSASAIYGQADLASYSSSKFAVRGITEGLDIEWRKHGIRVFDVMPLFVQTDMVTDMDEGSIKNMGVNLQPNDIAKAVWKLATGHTLLKNTHHPIGTSTKWMYRLSAMSPQLINRLSNIYLTRR